MRIDATDHLVLTVRELHATIAFYTRVLGMEVITFGEGRQALAFGSQKVNLHEVGHEYQPKAAFPTPGAGDLCFVTTTERAAVLAHLRACGIQVEAGPVPRMGAHGPIVSVYFRDQDGNLLEVSSYTTKQQSRPPAP